MNTPPKELKSFESLVEVVRILRSPSGCPWDKEQNHKTLTSYALEEVCELIEAIEKDDLPNIIEELGDVLLQVVLHAQIGTDENTFSIQDVIQGLNKKLIERHPHVFGDVVAQNSKVVLENWQKIKENEKKDKPKDYSFGLPQHLPALQKAHKIGKKTEKVKFDWPNAIEALKHVESEMAELKVAIANNDSDNIEEEFGDLLFTIAQVARQMDVDSEKALRRTNSKVEDRWVLMQKLAEQRKLEFNKLEQSELENLWVEAKKILKK